MAVRYLDATREIVVQLRFRDPRKDEVKALGARYNGSDQGWYLRADMGAERVAKLESLGFEMPDGWKRAMGVETADTRGASAVLSETIALEPPPRGCSVSELCSDLKTVVLRAMPQTVWVRGIARVRQSPRAGTVFNFDLVEPDGRSGELARLAAVVWGSDVDKVLRPLHNAGLEVTDGLAVCVRARVGFSVKYGRAELQVQEFDPAASLGEIALQRDKVLRALTAEGLAKLALQRPLPLLPMRVALVSSVGSDGHRDFCTQLASTGYGFAVTEFDVRVQGDALEGTVLSAFASIAADPSRFDLVVVTRGGGSKGDLAGWDNLAVGRAVANCSVKVMIAIGHTNDATALDAIALSMPTPTAAGRFLAEHVAAADARAATAFERVMERVAEQLEGAAHEQQVLSADVAHLTRALLDGASTGLSRAAADVEIRVSNRVRVASERLHSLGRSVERAPLVLRSADAMLERFGASVERGAARQLESRAGRQARAEGALLRAAPATIARAAQRLRLPELAVRMADPVNILRRGFALLRDADGTVLTSAAQLRVGDAVAVELRDGQLRARVEASNQDQPATPATEATS